MFPLKDLFTHTHTHTHAHTQYISIATHTGTQLIHQNDLEGNALVSQLHT